MNFDKKDIKFTNNEIQVGPEFGDIHGAREQYANENRHQIVLEPTVPLNIPGLTPLNGRRLPATRRWFTPTGSFERNGFFNVHTHNFNTKWLYYSFFIFVLWGVVQPLIQARHNEIHHDNFESGGSMYDKLLHRTLPGWKFWNRPS